MKQLQYAMMLMDAKHHLQGLLNSYPEERAALLAEKQELIAQLLQIRQNHDGGLQPLIITPLAKKIEILNVRVARLDNEHERNETDHVDVINAMRSEPVLVARTALEADILINLRDTHRRRGRVHLLAGSPREIELVLLGAHIPYIVLE